MKKPPPLHQTPKPPKLPAPPKKRRLPSLRIRWGIGFKLVSLIGVLLGGSVLSIVWLSTRLFVEDNTALIQQMNSDLAASISLQTREYLEALTEKMRVVGTGLQLGTVGGPPQNELDRIVREAFGKDTDLQAIQLIEFTGEEKAPQVRKDVLADGLSSDPARTASFRERLKDQKIQATIRASAEGETSIFLAQTPSQQGETDRDATSIGITVPFISDPQNTGKFTHAITAVVSQTRFSRTLGESAITTLYIVDRTGKLLAHSDPTRAATGESLAQLGIVKRLMESQSSNEQTRYFAPAALGANPGTEGEARLASFRRIGFAGLSVVAEVAEAKALETSKKVEFRSALVGLIVLSLAFFIGFLFSGSITWPIKELMNAARQISAGDFAIQLAPRSSDEVGHLSLAFNEMAKGLEERDRVKDVFNKFHNREIAEKLLSGEVRLGGERKEAVVFFSDVRGFTGMSETMEPEEVVVMLNEYMSRMVKVIRSHGGIVDKYVGDAIMALWGIPLAGPDDTYNAVKACIEMRTELAALNHLRISRGQFPLKIGMGLNVGTVIAGNIGSEEKMEYTVIGDTVNTASRMESMTKEFGTDLLIPKDIADRLSGRFVFEHCQSAKVKGKKEALEIFKVTGVIHSDGRVELIETPYSSYAAEKSDKVVHDESKILSLDNEKTRAA